MKMRPDSFKETLDFTNAVNQKALTLFEDIATSFVMNPTEKTPEFKEGGVLANDIRDGNLDLSQLSKRCQEILGEFIDSRYLGDDVNAARELFEILGTKLEKIRSKEEFYEARDKEGEARDNGGAFIREVSNTAEIVKVMGLFQRAFMGKRSHLN